MAARFIPFVAILCSLAAQYASGNQELTVERIFGSERANTANLQNVEWSPDGRRVAYLASGSRGSNCFDLRVTDTSSGASRILVPCERLASMFSSIEDQSVARFQWAPDGSALLFISAESLTWLDLQKPRPRVLISGDRLISDPKISPDGRWVSFVQDHNLRLVDVRHGGIRALTKDGTEELRKGEADWLYQEEFGLTTGYWWAPDSSCIAFLEMDETQVAKLASNDVSDGRSTIGWRRYPQPGGANPLVRVSVLRVDRNEVRTVDTGAEPDVYIPRVRWLPDSKHLAIERLNRTQTKIDLLIADLASGACGVLLSERDPYWINVHDDLYFFTGRSQFLWSSERSGYRHLYLYGMDGHLIRQITNGDWEVSNVAAIDEARALVYFVAAEKTPLERHVYRVAIDGSNFARLTQHDGWHQASFAPDARAFVDTYSSVLKPPAQNLVRADGTVLASMRRSAPANLPCHISVPEFLQVKAHDGMLLNAMLIKPENFDPGRKYPVIVYVNGGPKQQVVTNAWGGSIFLWHQMMATKGFLIFAMDNRGSSGRGHLFEEPIHCRLGAQELSDQRDGITYLRTLPYVDPARIGIWGSGYGGHMALHAIFEDPQDFIAAFAESPVTDWLLSSTAFAERYLEVPRRFSVEFEESSPVHTASQLRGKLLITAFANESGQLANIARLEKELNESGKHAEVFPPVKGGEGPSSVAIFRRATAFFMENLAASTDSQPAAPQ